MTPFQRAYVPASERAKVIDDHVRAWRQGNAEARALTPASDEAAARAAITAAIRRSDESVTIFKNDRYTVSQWNDPPSGEGWPAMTHLSIKRNDRGVIHDWRELQEIKNLIVGEEHEAVELYPAESRRVDTANQYHLWVLTDSKCRFPFGFNDGRFVFNSTFGKAVNRILPKT